MKERPILFSGPMVLSILEGRKTQTRRVVTPQPLADEAMHKSGHGRDDLYWVGRLRDSENAWRIVRCPYGVPGDRLWVRETFHDAGGYPIYRADEPGPDLEIRWSPAIHMPRWACRLVLEVTAVRVERLQQIGDLDAMREGCEQWADTDGAFRASFCHLWDSINAKRAPWASNPWVWVVSFDRVPAGRL